MRWERYSRERRPPLSVRELRLRFFERGDEEEKGRREIEREEGVWEIMVFFGDGRALASLGMVGGSQRY
jgi:hypothetical protein